MLADPCSGTLFIRLRDGNNKNVHEEVWLGCWCLPTPSVHPAGSLWLLWTMSHHEHPPFSAWATLVSAFRVIYGGDLIV